METNEPRWTEDQTKEVFGSLLTAIAVETGLHPQQVIEALRHGNSIAQVGRSTGCSAESLRVSVVRELQRRLGRAVRRGQLSKGYMLELLTHLSHSLPALIEERHLLKR